ncbi:MAG: shikimate dehydrogenase [Henriciella sp.]
MTKLLGVIGDPISHSMSPLIHNGWLRDLSIDATYEAMHVPAGEISSALKTLESRDIIGVNVTLPHKHDALAACTEATKAAAKIGAANTLTFQSPGHWHADNTDAPGFLRALGETKGSEERVLVLGAGGSARAIVFALTNRNIPVTIVNRTVLKAAELAAEFGASATAFGDIAQYKDYIDSATIVVNTTSMGYGGDVLALPKGEGRTFFDISYGKIAAPQLAHAAEQGWNTKDGLTMLVAQAAYSFESWFGEMPSFDAALERCQFAIRATQ